MTFNLAREACDSRVTMLEYKTLELAGSASKHCHLAPPGYVIFDFRLRMRTGSRGCGQWRKAMDARPIVLPASVRPGVLEKGDPIHRIAWCTHRDLRLARTS